MRPGPKTLARVGGNHPIKYSKKRNITEEIQCNMENNRTQQQTENNPPNPARLSAP